MSGPSVENRQTEACIWASLPTPEGRMSESRKLAAILVADVVGYSRLATSATWSRRAMAVSWVPAGEVVL
jgi:class 3 adenylate cyclase